MGALVRAGKQQEHVRREELAQQYLTFLLGGEMFAIDILNIKEIIEYGQLTEVPLMPQFLRGVINLRGAAVPVIDLAVRFGRKQTEISRRTCIVIIEVQAAEGRRDVGIVVDAVSEVLEIASANIEAALSLGANIRADFIQGIGKVNDRFIIILNINNILSNNDLHALERVGNV